MIKVFRYNLRSALIMRIIAFFCLIFQLPLFGKAQSYAVIRNVDFTVRNDSLVVTYELNKAKNQERFNVSLKLSTASGKTITPYTLTGDVGGNISGGKTKQIIWDINKDNLFINEKISVEVIAEIDPVNTTPYPRGTAVVLSAIVPGLGISKMNNGGPYWVMAIAVYGCAAGSYLYYQSAESNYDKYLAMMDESQRNSLYSKVQTQNNISDVLMYSAGAIWLGNMIWTIACPNKTKPNAKGVSLRGSYNPELNVPMVGLTYTFP